MSYEIIIPNEQMNNICLEVSRQISSMFFGETTETESIVFNQHLYSMTRGNQELYEFMLQLRQTYKDTSFVMFNNKSIRLFNAYELFMSNSKMQLRVIPSVLGLGDLLVYKIIYDRFNDLQYLLNQYLMFYGKFANGVISNTSSIINYIHNNMETIIGKKIQLPLMETIHTMCGDTISNVLGQKLLFIRFNKQSNNYGFTLFLEHHKDYEDKFAIVSDEIFRPDEVDILKTGNLSNDNLYEFLKQLIMYGRI